MLNTNIAGCDGNTTHWNWLLMKVVAALNNKVKMGECRNSRFYNQGFTVDDVVNTAGFTKIMITVAIDVHYGRSILLRM